MSKRTESPPVGTRPRIRRLIVAVDASRSSLQALEAVAELAAAWRAEVSGLFVEDENLLRWASLPFASEVERSSATVRRRDSREVELHLRSRAQYAEQVVVQVARQLSLPSSFRTVRGRVASELLTQISADDLLIVGKGRQSQQEQPDLGSTARIVVSRVRGQVLMLAHGLRVGGPVAVVYHDTPEGRVALGTALDLVAGRARELMVLLLSGREQVLRQLEAEMEARDLHLKTDFNIRDLVATDASHILDRARALGANVLVVPAGTPELADEKIAEIVRRFAGHVLIVRSNAEA